MFIEINPLGASKGSAIPYIASYYNIPLSNTIAFGDGVNDKEMLETANIGVAMKNATGTVRFLADDVTDFDNKEGGVGKYLEEFFDINK
ncbi:MAG: HAD-IIB family hydrolase [Breznakia sp.]